MDEVLSLVFPLLIACLFYGAYFVLFILCVHTLISHKRAGYRWHLGSMSLLFALSTIQLVLDIAIGSHMTPLLEYYFGKASSEPGLYADQYYTRVHFGIITLFFLSNAVGDTVIVYRCHIVWGYSKRITVYPFCLFLGTRGCGILFCTIPSMTTWIAFNVSSMVTNIVVTSLTAGRIWWINRKARLLLGEDTRRWYRNSTAMILESGAVLALWMIAILVVFIYAAKEDADNEADEHVIFGAYSTAFWTLPQIIGIVPTLIIVRVGLGISTENVEASVASFRAADHVSGGDSIPPEQFVLDDVIQNKFEGKEPRRYSVQTLSDAE